MTADGLKQLEQLTKTGKGYSSNQGNTFYLILNSARISLLHQLRESVTIYAGSTHSLSSQCTEVGNGVFLFSPPTLPIQTALEIADE